MNASSRIWHEWMSINPRCPVVRPGDVPMLPDAWAGDRSYSSNFSKSIARLHDLALAC
jgi:hypothetical protein